MRQQFSTDLNIHISQFAADFVKNLRRHMDDDRVPELGIQNYGYMYLADNEGFAGILRANQSVRTPPAPRPSFCRATRSPRAIRSIISTTLFWDRSI